MMYDISKSSRKRRVEWPDNEIQILLDIWEERVDDLRMAKKNIKILEELSDKLHMNSIQKSSEEVKTKIHNLTKKYRTEKHVLSLSGETDSSWCYFERVGKILGRRTYNEDALLDETSIGLPTPSEFPLRPFPMCKIETDVELLDSQPEESRTSFILPDCVPSTSSQVKRQNISIHKDLLREIKRANLAAEKEMRLANEIAKESLSLQREILELFKSQKN